MADGLQEIETPDHIPYENLADFRNAFGVTASVWSPIFPENQRESVLREDLSIAQEANIEELVSVRAEQDRQDLEEAREKLADAESIRIMQKRVLAPQGYVDLHFHQRDYKRNGGHIDGRTRFRLSVLLGALNLPEKDLMELINALEGPKPNFSKDGFFQILANKSGKVIEAFRGDGDVAVLMMEYLPQLTK